MCIMKSSRDLEPSPPAALPPFALPDAGADMFVVGVGLFSGKLGVSVMREKRKKIAVPGYLYSGNRSLVICFSIQYYDSPSNHM